MPFLTTPTVVREALPSTTEGKCSAFSKLFRFPQILLTFVGDIVGEDGNFTDAFKAMLCALSCVKNGGGGGGGGTPNPNMPAPTGVNATDGTYDDHIQVTWNAATAPSGIAAVTSYKIYRSTSDNADPNAAALIATVAAPLVTYNDPVDTDLAQGSTYNYWLKATNGTDTSAFSASDVGSASAPTASLTAVTDLAATQGFDDGSSAPIALVFTPLSGATRFDLYRNTVNDFATATKVMADFVPQSTTDHFISTTSPDQAWDNTGEWVAYHFPPSPIVHYFFWVITKKNSPPAVSLHSNAAEGWVRSFYAPYLGPSPKRIDRNTATLTEGVDFNGPNVRIVLTGGGAAGAGGSQIHGGAGGGGPAVVVKNMTVAGGSVITYEDSPDVEDTGNSPADTSGGNGSDAIIKLNGVEIMRAGAGAGGEFNGSGDGAGGAGGIGTGAGTVIYNGRPGKDASGPSGGRSGFRFGTRRYPGAHYNNFLSGSWTGDGVGPGFPGSGCYAAPGVEVLSVGGKGFSGFGIVVGSS